MSYGMSPERGKEVIHSAALSKAQEIKRENTPKLDSFGKVYDKQAIELDKETEKYADQVREKNDDSDPYLKKMNEKADIFEALLYEQIEMSEWLGPNITTSLGSRYDDYENKADLIIRYDDPDHGSEPIFLSLDITTDSEIGKKIEGIQSKIISNKLARVKYYKSELDGYKGPLEQIPNLVVRVAARHLDKLPDLWVNTPKKLIKHELQIIILSQIVEQLRSFEDYSYYLHKEKSPNILQRALSHFEKVLEQKKASGDFPEDVMADVNDDYGHRDIISELRKMDRLRH